MAKNIGKRAQEVNSSKSATWTFPLERQDLIYIAIGVGVILLGYILMYTGVTEEPAVVDGKWNNPMAVVVAPLLLVVGYCVIIPIAILRLFGKKKNQTATQE